MYHSPVQKVCVVVVGGGEVGGCLIIDARVCLQHDSKSACVSLLYPKTSKFKEETRTEFN